GAHRRAAAVAMRLTRDLETADAEVGGGGGFNNTRQCRDGRRTIRGDLIELRPADVLVVHRALQRMQPAPAFLDLAARLVVGRIVDLEETLRATLITDQRAIALGEGSGGKQHCSLFRRRGALMID